MTREEREDAINCFKNKIENEVYGSKYNKLALEALEQDPTTKASITMMRLDYEARLKADMVAILDAIRSEIRLEKLGYPPSAGYYQAIEKVLQIIDKYKTEFEVEDGN